MLAGNDCHDLHNVGAQVSTRTARIKYSSTGGSTQMSIRFIGHQEAEAEAEAPTSWGEVAELRTSEHTGRLLVDVP